jgi:hypothetical protein
VNPGASERLTSRQFRSNSLPPRHLLCHEQHHSQLIFFHLAEQAEELGSSDCRINCPKSRTDEYTAIARTSGSCYLIFTFLSTIIANKIKRVLRKRRHDAADPFAFFIQFFIVLMAASLVKCALPIKH